MKKVCKSEEGKRNSACKSPEARDTLAPPYPNHSAGDKVQEVGENQDIPSLIQAWMFLEML